jgi:hypothetical protein
VWDASETVDKKLQWLVQDHLGSTRMVVDRSGSLGGIRRHDFAPFGDELFAGQKFREYLNQPQHWNRYSYALNNPLIYVDEDGRNALVAWAIRAAIAAGGCYLASPHGQRTVQTAQRHGVNLYNWTLTNGRYISNQVWQLGPAISGRVIDGLRGVSDAFYSFRAIDGYGLQNHFSYSVKSLDIFAKTYKNDPRSILTTITRAVDSIANWSGGRLPTGQTITSGQIAGRILEVVIPKGPLTQQQLKYLDEAYKYAQSNNVTLIISQTQ